MQNEEEKGSMVTGCVWGVGGECLGPGQLGGYYMQAILEKDCHLKGCVTDFSTEMVSLQCW